MRCRSRSSFAFLSILLALLPCSAPGEKLKVLATFAPIYSITANVAGDAADVEMLLGSSVGPHDFALAPKDLKRIAAADVIVMNGLGVEASVAGAIKNSRKRDAIVVNASEAVEKKELLKGSSQDGHHHHHDHGGADNMNPHVWLDPILAAGQARAVADGLAKRDPANAGVYLENAKRYAEKLQALDSEIREATGKLQNKRLLTFHDSFGYFARRYGMEVVGVFQPFPGKEPTPKYLRKLRDTIVSKKVAALFAEPQYAPKMLQSMAEDLKIPIAVINPMETGEPSPEYYERTMRENLASLVRALHGK